MRKGFSQLQLAIEIGFSDNAYISKAERGVNGHHFSIEHLVKIAKVLEVEAGVFLEGV